MTYEITIGIPIYNKEKYIALTLETALAQTYQSTLLGAGLDDTGASHVVALVDHVHTISVDHGDTCLIPLRHIERVIGKCGKGL